METDQLLFHFFISTMQSEYETDLLYLEDHHHKYVQKQCKPCTSYLIRIKGELVKFCNIPYYMQAHISALYVILSTISKWDVGDIQKNLMAVDWSKVEVKDFPVYEEIDSRCVLVLQALYNINKAIGRALGTETCDPIDMQFFSTQTIFDIYVERYMKVDWSQVVYDNSQPLSMVMTQ